MSRSPSPRRLKQNTAIIRARPGNSAIHHSPETIKPAPSATMMPHSAADAVGPPAEIAGGDSGKAAHQEHQHDGTNRDEGVEPGRHDDAAENIAAKLVGAEPVRR